MSLPLDALLWWLVIMGGTGLLIGLVILISTERDDD